MTRFALFFGLALVALAQPAVAQGRSSQPDSTLVRDETSRLAVAVLGRVCLLNLGDIGGVLAATAQGGEYGFVEPPAEVAEPLLQGRSGYVRVLRRSGLGAVTVVATNDGICSVWSEFADAGALIRHMIAMVDRGGLKDGAKYLPLDTHDEGGTTVTDSYLMPVGWYAAQLGKRFGDDGTKPLALVLTVSAPGKRPMEAVLTVSRKITKPQ